MRKSAFAALTTVVAALALALSACGTDSELTPVAPAPTTAPKVYPSRIVSLSPAATEMLFAIGAGDQVEAVDDQSNYPPEAPRTKLSGFEPNVEAIARYKPDLVVMQAASIRGQLQKLGIELLVQPAAENLADTYEQITELGRVTGHEEDAQALIERMQRDIDALLRQVDRSSKPLTYYYELDNTYYSATSKTFIGSLFTLVGLRNIADGAADKTSEYPQLSAEYIIDRNPDLIFLADTKCCRQSARTVAARPGWSGLKAVKNRQVIALDDDIASRWGPRVVDLLRRVVEAANAAGTG
jgi:iron complex transport system substrate-binding protein